MTDVYVLPGTSISISEQLILTVINESPDLPPTLYQKQLNSGS